jgi:protein TonB
MLEPLERTSSRREVMTQAALYEPRKKHPIALTIVVLMHGAAITALALSKTEVFRDIRDPTKIFNVKPDELPPPPEPPKQVERTLEPQQPTVIDKPPPLIRLETKGPVTEWKPLEPTEVVIARPGPVIIDQPPAPPPPPPPPPPPQKLQPARAKANLSSYVSDADYPTSAIRAEEQGTTRFRLTVGPDGRVTGCTVTGSSGSSALDSATCRLMKSRARFTPARDSSGNPTSDTVSNAIRWILPED